MVFCTYFELWSSCFVDEREIDGREQTEVSEGQKGKVILLYMMTLIQSSLQFYLGQVFYRLSYWLFIPSISKYVCKMVSFDVNGSICCEICSRLQIRDDKYCENRCCSLCTRAVTLG